MLVKQVYRIVSEFPAQEKYGLSDQLRRAVISVASNIAEGTGRYSYKEKIHFVEIAYGSLMEVLCQLILAVDLKLVQETDVEIAREIIEDLGCQLSALRRSQIEAEEKSKKRNY